MKASRRCARDRRTADLDFTVHVDDGDRAEDRTNVVLDLRRVLGVCTVRRDWDGRRYFALPSPFEDVRVYDGARYAAGSAPLARLILALNFFNLHRAA